MRQAVRLHPTHPGAHKSSGEIGVRPLIGFEGCQLNVSPWQAKGFTPDLNYRRLSLWHPSLWPQPETLRKVGNPILNDLGQVGTTAKESLCVSARKRSRLEICPNGFSAPPNIDPLELVCTSSRYLPSCKTAWSPARAWGHSAFPVSPSTARLPSASTHRLPQSSGFGTLSEPEALFSVRSCFVIR